MGLEVHAELSTESKIFCGCKIDFGGEPNSRVCPVCSGMPGVLPKLNRSVVEYAVLAGIALNCSIARKFKFDRKNYFYPDLPKAYQVSQLYMPVCTDGYIELDSGKKINIREIHIEEDAGKLTHDPLRGITRMDFNRCGVPLIEIVSQPDFRSAGEVTAYLEKLQEILLYLNICDCRMHEGSLRVDVNLSVRREGGEPGVRTETKNLNSFKAIERAVKYETARQIEILQDGGRVMQETRRWDDDKGASFAMRSKENAQDYRYFPEPDLLPVNIDNIWFENIKNSIPESAQQKRERYMRDFNISEYEARILTGDKNISGLFERISERSGEPLETAHLIIGEVMRFINDMRLEDLNLDEQKLSYLIGLVLSGGINRTAYKEVIGAVILHGAEPDEYIEKNGLLMMSDGNIILDAVNKVLAENADAAAKYRRGKAKAFGFLMGQIMKKLNGTGNPDMVKTALENALKGGN
ncbi:MAG: Asp-tRNA(Asn)/Glu-tRNA(Gln) amidotransferase subunit GatB [Oscillospiraceae bacterium]|nr:Asp-tRNA(Asn)/Glu-tRNA(Gln) amidotransferase subunit GatB [Oscillospiraceae bacterium]